MFLTNVLATLTCPLLIGAIHTQSGRKHVSDPYSDFLSASVPQFPKVFPHPTGKNGCEDYVKASDLLQAGGWNELYSQIERLKEPATAPPGARQSGNLLAVEIKCRDRFKRALRLVEVGNKKPDFYLRRPVGAVSAVATHSLGDFTFHSGFNALARFQAVAADADFGSRDPAAGSDVLANALQFAARLCESLNETS